MVGIQTPSLVSETTLGSRLRRCMEDLCGPDRARGLLGILDQAIVSGTRFLVTVLLGRVCGADELGRYALGTTVLILIAAVQESLITLPYTAFCHRRDESERRRYAGNVLKQFAVLSAIAALFQLLLATVYLLTDSPNGIVGVMCALVGVLPLFLLHEFCRRIGFAHRDVASVVVFDSAFASVTGLLLILASLYGVLSGLTTLLLVGMAYGTVGGVWLYKSIRNYDFWDRQLLDDIFRHWSFGKWILAAESSMVVRSYLGAWVLALYISEAATGIYTACMMVVVLANPLLIGVSNVLAPDVAHGFASGGIRAARRIVWKTTMGMAMLATAFFLLMTLCGEYLITLVYGTGFSGASACIAILVWGVFVEAVGTPASNGLWAIERTRLCFIGNLLGMIAAVVLTVMLAPAMGIVGAASGHTGAKLITNLFLCTAFVAVTKTPALEGVTL